jgi:hypothetical protein
VVKERDIQELLGGFKFPCKFFIHDRWFEVA